MKRKLDANDAPTVEIPSDPTNTSPSELPSFDSFNLDRRLLQAIATLKFDRPTPVQAQAIPLAIEGRDILAKSKTGSGKTAAYVLPCIQSVLNRKKRNPKEKSIAVLVLVPTRELADQVTKSFIAFSSSCGKEVKALNLTQRVSESVLNAKLQETPDVVVCTPGKASQLLNNSSLSLQNIQKLVVDEADLVLSYGYENDIETLAKALPQGIQTFLVSATLTPEVDQLKATFCQNPAVVKIEDKEEKGKDLVQYVVKCAEEEKFLLIYVIFKLKLVKGKCIIFVEDVDRSYRLKLYLEQFGIRSCVLNSELPVNSRLHVVQEFNKGLYDILIAADDQEVIGGIMKKPKRIENEAGEDAEVTDEEDVGHVAKKPKTNHQKDFGVSRGIDFQNVSCVLNFDLPSTSKSYTHRIGRTARAGRSGMALSFVVPREKYGKHRSTSVSSAKYDEKVLEKIKARQEKKGKELRDYHFDMKQVEGFRYRMNDALRAVSRYAVQQARTREIKQELLKSEKLRKHFEENPDDLKALRHDTGTGGIVKVQGHMKHVPEYLIPGKSSKGDGDASLLRFNEGLGKKKPHRNGNRKGSKIRPANRKRLDPLKSFKAKKK